MGKENSTEKIVIESLKKLIINLEGIEKKSAQFQIDLLNDKINNRIAYDDEYLFDIKNIPEEKKKNKIEKEKRLLYSYKKIYNTSKKKYKDLTYKKIKFTQKKLVILQQNNKMDNDSKFIIEKKDTLTGILRGKIIGVKIDEIYENPIFSIYIDSIKQNSYNLEKKEFQLEIFLNKNREYEFSVESGDRMIGLYFNDLINFKDMKEKKRILFLFGIQGYILIELVFTENLVIQRQKIGIYTRYRLNHILEDSDEYILRSCALCGRLSYFNFIKCIKCGLNIHLSCYENLIFECKTNIVTQKKNSHKIKETRNQNWFANCSHCGINITQRILNTCVQCNLYFHIACTPFIINNCMVDFEKIKNEKIAKQKYSITDFIFMKLLGEGTFSRVYLVSYNNKKIALKILSKNFIAKTSSLPYIIREKSILQYKNIYLPIFYFSFQNDRSLVLAIEYIEGYDLYNYLLIKNIDEDSAKLILAMIFSAINFLHMENIIFRDLKLDNIMISKNMQIKLIDFGLANYSPCITYCGTVDTLAPEIIKNKSYNFLIDYWAAAIVLYELLEQLPPFYGSTQNIVIDKILNSEITFNKIKNEITQSFIKELLVKNPDDRLGAKNSIVEIKNHDYFKSVDFEKIDIGEVKLNLEIPTIDVNDKIEYEEDDLISEEINTNFTNFDN